MAVKTTEPRRGFASLDRSRLVALARRAGRIAHQKGTAHIFDEEEARSAGKKGGLVVSRNRAHMAAIGRRGGMSRACDSDED